MNFPLLIAFARFHPMAVLLLGACVGAILVMLVRPSRAPGVDELKARVDALERKP